jgi:multiple sugar transport system permease protein
MILLTTVPVIALFTFVNLIPILWGIITSLFDIPLYSSWDWTWVGIENYTEAFSDGLFWTAFENSIIFAIGSVALQLVVGIGLALLVSRSLKFGNVIRAIVFLPYLIPTAVVAFLGLWLANSQYGIANHIAVNLGLLESPIGWYGSPDFAMLAVIVTSSWKYTIFVTMMVLARLQGIPDSFYEAATMAGANAYQKFRDITLPNIKGVIFIVLLLRGIWMFNKFDIIWILTSGGPGTETLTLPIYAYRVAFSSSDLSGATTVSTILFALLLIVAALYFHFLRPSEGVRVE